MLLEAFRGDYARFMCPRTRLTLLSPPAGFPFLPATFISTYILVACYADYSEAPPYRLNMSGAGTHRHYILLFHPFSLHHGGS